MTGRLGARLSRLGAALVSLARDGGDTDRIVPPSGVAGGLVAAASAAMAVLAVLALAAADTGGRLSDAWSGALGGALTVRVASQGAEQARDVAAVLAVLEETPGVASAAPLDDAAQAALLAPWLGPDLPLDRLPLPRLVAVRADGLDVDGLRMRLAGEVPGAVLDDHASWRAPLARAARGLRALGWAAALTTLGVSVAVVTLAARAALAANAEVVRTLRLIGARDALVARAFTRRFTLRALAGSAIGTGLGLAAAALFSAGGAGLPRLGFSGAGWLAPLLVPPIAALAAFLATRRAALRALAQTR